MGLDERGRLIVQCGIEVLRVKEELLECEEGRSPEEQGWRSERLRQRKRELLAQVDQYAASRRTTFSVAASE